VYNATSILKKTLNDTKTKSRSKPNFLSNEYIETHQYKGVPKSETTIINNRKVIL